MAKTPLDVHVHISDDGTWFGTGLKPTPDNLLREMDAAGVGRSVILPTFGNCSNETVARAVALHPDRFIGFCTVDVHDADKALDAMRRAREAQGLRGMKIHPRLQAFDPNAPALDPIYELAAEYRWPIIFDTYLQSRTTPLHLLEPFQYDRLARRHPGMTIIMSHGGGHRYMDACFCARSNPNVYMDLCYTTAMFSSLAHRMEDFRFIYATLDQKTLFASDWPECSMREAMDAFRALTEGLEREKRDNILHLNMDRILSAGEEAGA